MVQMGPGAKGTQGRLELHFPPYVVKLSSTVPICLSSADRAPFQSLLVTLLHSNETVTLIKAHDITGSWHGAPAIALLPHM